MSAEHVEIVRRIFELGTSRDTAREALVFYDPALVWDVSRLRGVGFGEGIFHGHQGLRTWFRAWYDAWEDTRNDLEELIDAGDRVISVHTQRGRGRGSGIEIALEQYAVWKIENGKVTRVDWYLTREEALAAASARKPE